MAEDEIAPVRGMSADASIHKAQKAHARQELNNMAARQAETEEDFQSWADQALFNPITMRKKFEKLDDRMRRPVQKEETQKGEETQEKVVGETDVIEQIAEDYYQRNPELQKKTLMLLQQRLKNDDTADTILRKLEEFYTDKSLADEAVDFLIETASNREEIRNQLLQAKEQFNAAHGREIRAGRNIAEQARTFSKQGLGSPTALRDLYRNIVATPRTPHQIFEELTAKFKFSDMKNIIDFILHSLGSDMKAKGPSISKAELQRLFGEARTMQAILGVFRFFFARMKLIKGQFDRYDLTMPSRINFEVLARLLMKLLQERYPSPDKIIKLSFVLGISEEVAAQIIIFTQYRDALRHISPKLFQSERHRQDLLLTIIETLSDLEDELEEEEEEEEEE
ncbi:type III secretion system gatekeeper subunit SctW [Simkania negevensis]|uniref:Negative regulator of type III secretion n=1 Tax=Simkania negevensis (strain ATCC VR-1471 / DSM 27360 / Z) TaxID=331113 RepID=F8L9U3_SIMNZ|nr:type III secretion system gatekeeper subunit SctW [Simkania negevensis]CCB89644.1 negative regulator of type III secretion [Simkania negevensis Z]